ncbi:MAG: hypothetical protein ACRCS3_16120 [Paracoccaceae bacterium]
MGAVTVQQMAQRVNGLLEERLRLRGNSLADKLHRAGRRLPRRVRQAAARLSVAEAKSVVPKLLLQVDEGDVARDYDTCVRHLTSVRPTGGMMTGVVRIAASVAVGLLVLAVMAGSFVWLQGGV